MKFPSVLLGLFGLLLGISSASRVHIHFKQSPEATRAQHLAAVAAAAQATTQTFGAGPPFAPGLKSQEAAPSTPPLLPSASSCVKWRKTTGCSPSGPRNALLDKDCSDSIPSDESGFCECGNYVQTAATPCGHPIFTCAKECAQLPNPFIQKLWSSGPGGLMAQNAWNRTIPAVAVDTSPVASGPMVRHSDTNGGPQWRLDIDINRANIAVNEMVKFGNWTLAAAAGAAASAKTGAAAAEKVGAVDQVQNTTDLVNELNAPKGWPEYQLVGKQMEDLGNRIQDLATQATPAFYRAGR